MRRRYGSLLKCPPLAIGKSFVSEVNRVVDGFLRGRQILNMLTARAGLPVNVGLNMGGIDPFLNQSYRFFNRNGGSCNFGSNISAGDARIVPAAIRYRF